MAVNTQAYMEQYLKIRAKNGRLVPLVLNGPQQKAVRCPGRPVQGGQAHAGHCAEGPADGLFHP